MKEITMTTEGNIIKVEAEKRIIPDNSKKRNFVIKSWYGLGAVVSFIGFLLLISIEDGMKYFGNSMLQTVLMIVFGISMMGFGFYMCADARRHLNH